jgi:hypothetical protein
MRRFGLILLLMWLPLQSVWAVVAAACPHEFNAAGGHGAAHAHDHAHGHAGNADGADGIAADADDKPGNSVGSHCHGHGSAAAMAEGRVAEAGPRAEIVPSAYSRFVADHFLESPLRPPALHFA